MKKAELTLTVLFVVALLINLMDVPGGAILTILSLTALSMLYFYLSFLLFNDVPLSAITKKDAYQHTTRKRIIGSILTGMAIGILLMGILFMVERWPGAAVMTTYGLALLFVAGVVALIQYSQGKSPFYLGVLKRVVPYLVLGVILHFFSQALFLDFKYRNYPAYIEAVKAWQADPTNDALHEQMEVEQIRMHKPDYTLEEHQRRTARQ